MSSYVSYYRHSGKVHPSYIVFFILGIIITAVLSIFYSIAMYYSPSAYLNIIITVVYSFLASKLAWKITKWGKARNMIVWAISIVAYFIVFTYVHFAAYAAVVFRDEVRVIDFSLFLDFLWEPSYLLMAFKDIIVPQGVWTFSSNGPTVSGFFLLAIWLVEHLVALCSPFYFGHTDMERPFFEETGNWGKETICALRLPHQPEENFPQIKKAAERNDIDYFNSLKVPRRSGYCQISYYTDPAEELGTRYLTLTNVKDTVDRRGKASTNIHDIIRNLPVSPAFIAALESSPPEQDVRIS